MSCGTMIAMGLAGAGTGAQMYASEQEKSAMEKATQEELARQQEYQKKASTVFDQSLAKSTPTAFMGNQQQGADQAMKGYQALQAVPLTVGQDKTSPASSVVNTQNQMARTGLSNQANAPLFGYGNALNQMGNKDILTGANLGLISNAARGSQAVLPMELQQASQSQSGLAGIGSLLSTAGMLYGMYNATLPGLQAADSSNLGFLQGPVTNQYAGNAMAGWQMPQNFSLSGYGQQPFSLGGY